MQNAWLKSQGCKIKYTKVEKCFFWACLCSLTNMYKYEKISMYKATQAYNIYMCMGGLSSSYEILLDSMHSIYSSSWWQL